MHALHLLLEWGFPALVHGTLDRAGRGRTRLVICHSVGTLALHFVGSSSAFPEGPRHGGLASCKGGVCFAAASGQHIFPLQRTPGRDGADAGEVVRVYRLRRRVTSSWSGSPEKKTSYGKQNLLSSQERGRLPHLCARATFVSFSRTIFLVDRRGFSGIVPHVLWLG